MREKDKIKQLLLAFYKGETSLEQEDYLSHYLLTTEDLSAEFIEDREVFRLLYASKVSEATPSAEFESRFEEWLEKELADAESAKPLYQVSWFRTTAVIAASLSLLLGLGYWFSNRSLSEETLSEHEQLALYQQTKGILIHFSTQLNKGVDAFEKVENRIDKVDKIIDKTLLIK